jgi:hypothetical protein
LISPLIGKLYDMASLGLEELLHILAFSFKSF